MAHRQLPQFFASQIPEMDHAQIWNHRNRDPRLHLENGPSMLPTDNMAFGGVNSTADLSLALRPYDYPSSRFSSEVPAYRAANSGTVHNPYLQLSSSGSSSQFQSNQVLRAPSYHNQLTIGHGSSIFSPATDNERVGFKRKSPAVPLVYDRGNTSGYYCAGTSSNLHVSSNHLQPKPMPGPQYWPLDSSSMVSSYRNDNLSTVREEPQRNVRSRHRHALHIEPHPAGAYSSSNLPRHFQSTGSISGLNVAGQCSHSPESMAPHRRILSPDSYYFNNEMNQSRTGSSVANGAVEIDGAYNCSLTQSRNASALWSNLHCASTQGMWIGHNFYDQRPASYRAVLSHPPMGFAAVAVEDTGPSRVEAVASSRHSRPLSTIGRGSERNGRARNSYGRFQMFSYDDDAYDRWVSEGVVIMDPSVFYDSTNLFDQHRDMRLDIDSMSYEELLALEERIGDVRTGLSEDLISRCLTEMIYCSSDQIQDDQEEGICVICREDYKDRENLGRLKCGHDFHVSCIREWLVIKNACPICKAPALADTSKEKQPISL